MENREKAGWDLLNKLAREQRRMHRRCIQPEPCDYYLGGNCEYMAIMGHRRPCKPGDACTVKRVGHPLPRPAGLSAPPSRRADWYAQAESLYRQGRNDGEIAAAVGRSRSAIGQWRRRNALAPNAERGFCNQKPLNLPRLETLYKQGYSDPKIAAAVGCSVRSVFDWRKRTGRPANVGARRRRRQNRAEDRRQHD